MAAALTLGLVSAALIPGLVDHRYYEWSSAVSVETWTVHLPHGYQLMRQKSSPPRPDDGLRLFPAGSPA